LRCYNDRQRHWQEWLTSSIDVPLDVVAHPLRRKRLEAVALCDARAFRIGFLFVLLIVTVIGVDEIPEFADFVLQVNSFHLCLVVSVVCAQV
jgi:hypothetical protein